VLAREFFKLPLCYPSKEKTNNMAGTDCHVAALPFPDYSNEWYFVGFVPDVALDCLFLTQSTDLFPVRVLAVTISSWDIFAWTVYFDIQPQEYGHCERQRGNLSICLCATRLTHNQLSICGI
jgi:hypothetical protein